MENFVLLSILKIVWIDFMADIIQVNEPDYLIKFRKLSRKKVKVLDFCV